MEMMDQIYELHQRKLVLIKIKIKKKGPSDKIVCKTWEFMQSRLLLQSQLCISKSSLLIITCIYTDPALV